MAIEWTIESGSAISPGRLAPATAQLLSEVLGTAPDGVPVDGPLGEQPTVEFEFTLRATFGDARSAVLISSDTELDENGTPDPERSYATVTAYRTQLSVVVALMSAVALAELSGGELSGTGLDRRYPAGEARQLVEELVRLTAPAALREAVGRLAVRLGCATLSFS